MQRGAQGTGMLHAAWSYELTIVFELDISSQIVSLLKGRIKNVFISQTRKFPIFL